MRGIGRCAGMVLAAGLAGAAAAQEAPDADEGPEIFHDLCAECHTLTPHGVRPGQLDLSHFPTDAEERFERVVRHGQGVMPPAGRDLSEDELEALWAYVADVLKAGRN